MAEQEQQQMVSHDTPVNDGSPTGRAVSLARLLHYECSRLLQLYTEKEPFLMNHTPEGGRMVSLSQSTDGEPDGPERRVQLLHGALRQCLGLLHCVIAREEEEWGEMEGDYETLRKNVWVRLEHLLHSTKYLAETEDTVLEVTPDIQCIEETDGAAGGAFELKMWTHRVLLELIHWADHATQTLHVFHTEREGTQDV